MSFITSLFRSGKTEERLTVNDWANFFSYNGNTYPILQGSMQRGSKTETIQNDFMGYVGGAYKASGVVFACMVARMSVFTEARFQYQKLNNGRPGDLFGSKDLSILEKPWANGTTGDLLARAIQDVDLAGNHYVVREFDPKTRTERLRRLRPDWVDIMLGAAPDEAVKSDVVGYVYRPGGTQNPDLWEKYPIDGSNGTIAHWAPIPDPEAQYRGMSWLTPVLREISADKAMTSHKLKFFENACTPNLAVSFKETVTEEQFRGFMELMDQTKNGVEHAYETLYLGGGADVKVIGANLQQMDFKVSGGHGETRIAAAARIHPTLVGLAEGMHGSTLNEGNFKAARDLFTDATMRPLWRSLCGAYSVLVTEFGGSRLWYDDRDVSFLREDQLEVAQLKQSEATTISSLIMQGYTPDSVVIAVTQHDWRLLEHTGLYSVQLQPPLPEGAPDANVANPGQGADKSDGADPNAKAVTHTQPRLPKAAPKQPHTTPKIPNPTQK